MSQAVVSTYKIHLEGIRFRGRHGVSRAERGLLQDFIATVEIELPIGALPKTDTLSRVFDYGKLAEMVVDEGTKTSYRLLETLAQRVIARILEDSPAVSATVCVKKFGPPTAVSVDSASIELRGRRG
jgi:7,8-dihydroneopterin aldolase/epimerase/oxygenase